MEACVLVGSRGPSYHSICDSFDCCFSPEHCSAPARPPGPTRRLFSARHRRHPIARRAASRLARACSSSDFEFEYGDTVEDVPDGAPSLRTGMGNVLLQTPVAIFGLPALFHDRRGRLQGKPWAPQRDQFGINTGGGVKISLIGPVRARVDYRSSDCMARRSKTRCSGCTLGSI